MKRKFVYAGKRWNGDKIAAAWFMLDENGRLGPELLYPVTKLNFNYTGAIYEFETDIENDKTRVVFDESGYTRQSWENHSDLTAWAGKTAAAEAEKGAAAKMKRLAESRTLKAEIQNLRRLYAEARTSAARAAVLAVIIDAVTSK